MVLQCHDFPSIIFHARLCVTEFSEISVSLRETVRLALWLQRPAKVLSLRFLVGPYLCLEVDQNKSISEGGANAWGRYQCPL